jgi:hypothetical protein
MNSQTRSVTIASLAGLAAGVLVQGSKVITTGYLTPLDMFNPFNTFVLGCWVGALSIFPLIFVIIVIAATARKEGLRNSIFNGLAQSLASYSLSSVPSSPSRQLARRKNFPTRKPALTGLPSSEAHRPLAPKVSGRLPKIRTYRQHS